MRKFYLLFFVIVLAFIFINCGVTDDEQEDDKNFLCEAKLIKVEDLRDESDDNAFRIRLEFENGLVIFHEDYKYDTAVFWTGENYKIYSEDNKYMLELGSIRYGDSKETEESSNDNQIYICESKLTDVKYLKSSDEYNFGLRLDFENGLVILYDDYDKGIAVFWKGKNYSIYKKKGSYSNAHILELKRW